MIAEIAIAAVVIGGICVVFDSVTGDVNNTGGIIEKKIPDTTLRCGEFLYCIKCGTFFKDESLASAHSADDCNNARNAMWLRKLENMCAERERIGSLSDTEACGEYARKMLIKETT